MSTPDREPFARHLHPVEMALIARQGRHCAVRRCGEPVAVYGWYYRHERGVTRPVASERELCLAHGAAFAARHHLVLEPAPPLADIPPEHIEGVPPRPPTLIGMGAGEIAEQEAQGWHCDMPRCHDPARYLSGLSYATQAGAARRLSRFLCTRHARNFATNHGIDFAAVRPPEVPQ